MNEETRWMLNFLLHDLPFSQQLKLLEKSKKWAEMIGAFSHVAWDSFEGAIKHLYR